MGLALKIKEKMTPDTLKSGGSQGGETNMHPNKNEKDRSRASPTTSDDERAASHNGADKTQAFRGHRSRDSGIEIGHDSRFIEHVDAYPPNPERAPTGASEAGTHAKKNPVKTNRLPDQRRKSTIGGRTPGVDPVGGGKYSNEPATGPSPLKVPAEGAGAFTSSKAGFKPDYLTLEDPGDNTPHTRNSSARPSLQNTRAYKSDAPLGVRKRSIVDGYGKDPSRPDSRLVMEKPTFSPAGGVERGRGRDHEAQRPRPVSPGVTPDTSTRYFRDYAADFEAGGHPPRSDTVSSTNSGDEFGPGLELQRESSVERATVPYAGELDGLDDSLGRVDVERGKDITYSTVFGVKDSGIGRRGIHNGVIGNGASR